MATDKKVTSTQNGIKSRIMQSSSANLAGGVVSKKTFVKLKRTKPQKDLELKDFNSFIDYKEVKREQQLKKEHYLSEEIRKSNARVINEQNKISLLSKDNLNGGTKNEPSKFVFAVKKEKSILGSVLLYLIVIGLWVIAVMAIINFNSNSYYFSELDKDNLQVGSTSQGEILDYEGSSKSGQTGGVSGDGVTAIVYDNQYNSQLVFKSERDVKNLIVSDSIKQKTSCPANIVRIENEIINNYGVTAVNLCEIDIDFALELKGVVEYIYNNYPSARNYLTNLTIANVGDANFIAAFMPIFVFATSKNDTGYPMAVKTQIILNAKYFLNTSKLKSSVDYGSRSGYFPPNATRSSTVAHEFGHYLSYVALLKHYNSKQLNFVRTGQSNLLYQVYSDFDIGAFSYELCKAAYEKYKTVNPNISFTQFRGSISEYALSKDGNGNYIYDETIAEAFHDCYLNGDNAKVASKYIVAELESRL